MEFEILVKELMWEYNLSKRLASNLANAYKTQGRYEELVNIVKFKRHFPEIERRKS